MAPLLPGLFSTINCSLNALETPPATMRASTSAVPPGPNATTILTGFAGQSCADTACGQVDDIAGIKAATYRNLLGDLITPSATGAYPDLAIPDPRRVIIVGSATVQYPPRS